MSDFEPVETPDFMPWEPSDSRGPARPATDTWVVMNDVANERDRQELKWGPQDHVDVLSVQADPMDWTQIPFARPDRAWYEDRLAAIRAVNEVRDRAGVIAWDTILLEEVLEALVEAYDDPEKLREELVQVSAVTVAWMESLRRR